MTSSRFSAALLRPARPEDGASWAFVILPKSVSETLPRRGRTSVAVTLNGQTFQAMLEPDGQLSHWLKIEQPQLEAVGVGIGDMVELEVRPLPQEPEPEIPADLGQALKDAPEAAAVWSATTTLARVDWIHWIVSAKQAKTRAKRIADACDMLASGKKRVCFFDPSGFYSKAFRAPETLD